MNTIDQRVAVLLLEYWQDNVPADPETAQLCRALVAKVAPQLLPQVMMSGNPSRISSHVLTILQVLAERDQTVQVWLDQLHPKLSNGHQQIPDVPIREIQQKVRGNGNIVAGNDLWIGKTPAQNKPQPQESTSEYTRITQDIDGSNNVAAGHNAYLSLQGLREIRKQIAQLDLPQVLTVPSKQPLISHEAALLPVTLRFQATETHVKVRCESLLDPHAEFAFQLPLAEHWPLLHKALALLQEVMAQPGSLSFELLCQVEFSPSECQTLVLLTGTDLAELHLRLPRFIGQLLYNALTGYDHGPGGVLLNRMRQHAQEQHQQMSYRLHFSASAMQLLLLPWELLWAADGPLLINAGRGAAHARYLEIHAPAVAAQPQRRPLQMLAITPRAELPEAAVQAEQAMRHEAWSDLQHQGALQIHELTSSQDLQMYVRSAPPIDLVHFYGFGRLINGEAALLLDDAVDGKRWLSIHQFGPLLRQARLVVLHACQSASHNEQDSLISVAAALSNLRVPAVIALQSSIALPAGRFFLTELYRGLAAAQTIQQAMVEARLALHTLSDPGLHWYVPMVLLSTPTADSVQLIEH